jgi:hypothetical protein
MNRMLATIAHVRIARSEASIDFLAIYSACRMGWTRGFLHNAEKVKEEEKREMAQLDLRCAANYADPTADSEALYGKRYNADRGSLIDEHARKEGVTPLEQRPPWKVSDQALYKRGREAGAIANVQKKCLKER